MFYNLIYRSPLWGNINSYDRNIRIIIAGTILYVGTYLLLQSKYTNNIPQLQNYKKYIYHVFVSDFTTMMIQMKFGHDKTDQKNKKKSKKNKRNMKMKKQFQHLPLLNHSQNSQQSQLENKKQNDENSVSLPIYNGHGQKNQDSIESDISIPIYRPMKNSIHGEGERKGEVEVEYN